MKVEEIRAALAGFTLPEIAAGTGVSPRAVFNFMHANVTPSVKTIARMRAFVDGENHQQQEIVRFDAAMAEARAALVCLAANIRTRTDNMEREIAKLRATGGL